MHNNYVWALIMQNYRYKIHIQVIHSLTHTYTYTHVHMSKVYIKCNTYCCLFSESPFSQFRSSVTFASKTSDCSNVLSPKLSYVIMYLFYCFCQLTKVCFSILFGILMMMFPLQWRPRSQRHPLPSRSFTPSKKMQDSFFGSLKYLFSRWSTCILTVYPSNKIKYIELHLSCKSNLNLPIWMYPPFISTKMFRYWKEFWIKSSCKI